MRGQVLAAAALIALAGCSNGDAVAEDQELTGSANSEATPALNSYVGVISYDLWSEFDEVDPDCDALWESKGVTEGDQVQLRGADGTIAAVGELGPLPKEMDVERSEYLCTLGAEMSGITPGGKFYEASVGKWKSEAIPEAEVDRRRFVIEVK